MDIRCFSLGVLLKEMRRDASTAEGDGWREVEETQGRGYLVEEWSFGWRDESRMWKERG